MNDKKVTAMSFDYNVFYFYFYFYFYVCLLIVLEVFIFVVNRFDFLLCDDDWIKEGFLFFVFYYFFVCGNEFLNVWHIIFVSQRRVYMSCNQKMTLFRCSSYQLRGYSLSYYFEMVNYNGCPPRQWETITWWRRQWQ